MARKTDLSPELVQEIEQHLKDGLKLREIRKIHPQVDSLQISYIKRRLEGKIKSCKDKSPPLIFRINDVIVKISRTVKSVELNDNEIRIIY